MKIIMFVWCCLQETWVIVKRWEDTLNTKILSHYILILYSMCTLALIKMKANKIKLKWEWKWTSQELWIKIESIYDINPKVLIWYCQVIIAKHQYTGIAHGAVHALGCSIFGMQLTPTTSVEKMLSLTICNVQVNFPIPMPIPMNTIPTQAEVCYYCRFPLVTCPYLWYLWVWHKYVF